MQRYKSLILPMQGKSKSNLHRLYNKVYNPKHEEENDFSYCPLRSRFGSSNHQNSEKLLLYIKILSSLERNISEKETPPAEIYLLGVLSSIYNDFFWEYVNALSVNAKTVVRAVRDILNHIENAVGNLRHDDLSEFIVSDRDQMKIRDYR